MSNQENGYTPENEKNGIKGPNEVGAGTPPERTPWAYEARADNTTHSEALERNPRTKEEEEARIAEARSRLRIPPGMSEINKLFYETSQLGTGLRVDPYSFRDTLRGTHESYPGERQQIWGQERSRMLHQNEYVLQKPGSSRHAYIYSPEQIGPEKIDEPEERPQKPPQE